MLNKIALVFSNPLTTKIIFIVVVASLTVVLGSVLQWILLQAYKRVTTRKKSRLNKTKFKLLSRIILIVIYAVGFLLILSSFPELKKISYSIFASAGILAIVIGFATQEIFSNFIAGFFISLFEPFRIDDRVKIGNEHGHVDDITAWHTVIRTFNNQRLMIPNSKIAKEEIMNYSIGQEETLNFIDFGISYDSDITRAKRVIGEELQKSSYFLDYKKSHHLLAKEQPYNIRVIEHGEFSITLRLYAWSNTATEGFFLKTELLENVKNRFDTEGVEIPFPYRTLVEKKNLPKNKKDSK